MMDILLRKFIERNNLFKNIFQIYTHCHQLMNKTQFNVQKPKVRRINVRMLTQIREEFQTSKLITSAFRIGNISVRGRKNQHKNASYSKKTGRSSKSMTRKVGDWATNSEDDITMRRIAIIQSQMFQSLCSANPNHENSAVSKLSALFEIGEYINENFYSYSKIEKKIKTLNQIIKELQSCSLSFYGFATSGLLFFEYGNFSLSIFYLDKALKILERHKNYKFYCELELCIYKTVAKIFTQNGSYSDAKEMGYLLLRKSWKYHNIEEQMSAYDILGQISLEEGFMELSRYFHHRMCQGNHQNDEIVTMSNNELQKNECQTMQLAVYENIMVFAAKEKSIYNILSNHYRSQAEQDIKQIGSQVKHQFMYTHRSSNRVLRNHRKIERRLIDEKQSKQLFFIKPKDIKKMRKIITQFSSFIFQLRRKCEIIFLKNQNTNLLRRTNGF